MNTQTFIDLFGHIADAPGGIDQLRGLIHDLAVRGRLTRQESGDEPVQKRLDQIEKERAAFAAATARRPPKAGQLSDDVIPFKPPPGWTWVSLGRIALKLVDGSHNPPPAQRDGHPMLSARNVSNGAIRFDRPARRISDADFQAEHRRTSVAPGDILLCIVGTVGGSAVVPDDCPPFALQRSVAVIRTGALSAYVKVFLDSPTAYEYYRLKQRGSAQVGLYLGKLSAMPIPLPPMDEQRRIVERVWELMGLCNELEAQQASRAAARTALTSATLRPLSRAESAPELREALAAFAGNIDMHLAPADGDLAALKQLRQAILDLAVRGRLTHQDSSEEPAAELLKRISTQRDRMVKAEEIRKPRARAGLAAVEQDFAAPAGWEWASLGQLVLFSDSGWSPACLPHTRKDDSQWGVLKVSAVSWGDFRADEHKLLTPGLTPRPQIEVQDGDFLMSRANTSELVGRSVLVTDPPPRLMLSDKHVRLRFLDRVSAAYVNLVNGTSHARVYYASVATGTSASMRNITRGQILALPVPVPPLDEQERIMRVFSVLRSLCDELEQQLLDAQSRRRCLSESVTTRVAAVGVNEPS